MDAPINQRDLEDISRSLGRIEAKQDQTNGRVRDLELRVAWLWGAMAALGFILGLPAVVGAVVGLVLLLR